jgi:hypothetical protein
VVGDNWMLLPPSSGFTDPLFSSGMAMSATAVARIAEKASEMMRGDVAPERALPDYAPFFFREIEYIARIQHLFYLAATDFEVLSAALEVYRMGTLLGGVLSGVDGVHPHLQPLWGSGHGRFRELADRAHALVHHARFNGGEPTELAAELRALTRALDDWGFTRSGLNNPPVPNIYLFPALEMVRFVRSLGVGRSWSRIVAAAVQDSFRAGVRRPYRRSARAPGFANGSLLRLVARDIRILLDL